MKVKKDTVIRLIALVIVLSNQILCSTGKISFELSEEHVYECVSLFSTLVVSCWNAWKNNSVTDEAIEADEYMKELKEKRKMKIINANLKFRNNMDIRKNTNRIVLHHTASTTASPQDIHKWHLNNGWAGAGYHYLVRKNGSVYSLRPEKYIGVHSSGANSDSIGVVAEGNFQNETMCTAQMNSLMELVSYLKNKYGISKVQRHSDINSTACPGKNYPFSKIVSGTITTVKKPTLNNNSTFKTIQAGYNSKWGSKLGKIVTDGSAGLDTKKHLVKALQYEMNKQYKSKLAYDGSFGPACKKVFLSIKQGSKGNITWLCQAYLYIKGYNPKGLDSNFGPGMKTAVKSFQKSKGLSVDGIIGKNTAYKLFN